MTVLLFDQTGKDRFCRSFTFRVSCVKRRSNSYFMFSMEPICFPLSTLSSIYGKLVTECLERGYTEGEITIKIEEPGGIRTEKYLKKSEIYRELSTIGSEGKELAALLRVSDA